MWGWGTRPPPKKKNLLRGDAKASVPPTIATFDKKIDFFHFDYYIIILHISILKFSNAYKLVNDVPVNLNFLLQPLQCG